MPYLLEPVRLNEALLGGDPPSVEAGPLLLRPWRPEDALQLVEAFRDALIQRWHLRRFDSTGESEVWMKERLARWRDRAGGGWAITPADEDAQVLGEVAFRTLHPGDGLAEVSCWVAPGSRQRHVASTATRALTEWGLTSLGLVRVELVHSTRNGAACLAALRAGFAVEGTKRSLQQYTDGFHDMHLHSRVRGDVVRDEPVRDEPVRDEPVRDEPVRAPSAPENWSPAAMRLDALLTV
jgi:RimJ/RimL family protein N-acetyltransferase